MAVVYILYSPSIDSFYIGSCLDLKIRLQDHIDGKYKGSYTYRAKGWKVFLSIKDLRYEQARRIEAHIKRMKSRKYIKDLARYPEMVCNLKDKYI